MGGRYWVWLVARLLMAIVIVGWAASYALPGAGEKEFQRSLEAMKQVHAVRVATVTDASPTQHLEMSWEIVCAQNAYHFKQHLVESDPDRPTKFDRDEIEVGVYMYERQPDDTWQASRHSNLSRTAMNICGTLAQGNDSRILPDLATMIRRGIIQKGDKKTVNGVRCREWNVTLKAAKNGLEHDTICLGLDDHLPYEETVDWQHVRTTYSDYNAPFQIELPPAAVQPASASSN